MLTGAGQRVHAPVSLSRFPGQYITAPVSVFQSYWTPDGKACQLLSSFYLVTRRVIVTRGASVSLGRLSNVLDRHVQGSQGDPAPVSRCPLGGAIRHFCFSIVAALTAALMSRPLRSQPTSPNLLLHHFLVLYQILV